MANQLNVAMQQKIRILSEMGWSFRKIARELGIDRETVARYAQRTREDSKPANATPGSAASEFSKPANATPGSFDPRSHCEPFRELIQDMLKQDLSGKRIWQDLTYDHGFQGSYSSIKRFLRRMQRTNPLPFRRMESLPGQEAQIDFGKGAFIQQSKGEKRRRSHVFRITLSHSRKGYSQSTYQQRTDDFIHCLENAFWYFGGVPETLVIDNPKAAVTHPDWFDPDLNPRLQAFAEHYGTVILPTKSYTPRHKGKIERGIGYVQDNGLKGRTFSSLEEQNRFLLEWEANVADTRIHGTTRQQVGKVFLLEKSALRPLPQERFPFFHEGERKVHRDGHVEVGKAYYSVPPEYVGRRVLVRWDSHLVRIFTGSAAKPLKQIAVHATREPGHFSTDPQHIASEKISCVEHGATWLLVKVRRVGLQTGAWAEAMLALRGIQGVRVLAGLLSLTRLYPSKQIDQACGIALSHQAFKLRVIRELLKRHIPPQGEFEFMEHHPIIREIADYGDFTEVQFHPEGAEVFSFTPDPPMNERGTERDT